MDFCVNNYGTLYIVATPIGNLADFSPRAIEILRQVDFIAAEDTRHSQGLLKHFGIATPMLSLHEHNEHTRAQQCINYLQQNKSIGLISDAGTPLISDPGYQLVRAARANNIKVTPIPGACALITALSAAGLPSDRFIFEGFLTAKSVGRQKRLELLRTEPRTLVFYEAPHRILDLINDMITIFGATRYAVLARELTKTFETIHGDKLANLKIWLTSDSNQQKGEFVVLVEGNSDTVNNTTEIDRILTILLAELPTSQATELAAKITGEKKNKLYEQALRLKANL